MAVVGSQTIVTDDPSQQTHTLWWLTPMVVARRWNGGQKAGAGLVNGMVLLMDSLVSL